MCHREIKENAIFIADSHYPHHGKELFNILKAIDKREIITEQLFLIGDNFDLLFGYNQYIKSFSQDAITILDKLSYKIEIYYFEGNHDFLLSDIFKNIHIYTREEQPISFNYKNRIVSISHGDKYDTNILYTLYSKILRNRYFIKLLKPFEKNIINHQIDKLKTKKICHKFKNFEKKVDKILENYSNSDIVIEGHFHQEKIIKNYYSLPSLACQKKIGIIKNSKIEFILFR
ncbi:FIG022708: hypothetical protein [hydrothermal vent metagenome]|uniref:Calcineurin-like phosphoesterase domain-containing protein n=1 Tax=hydrothermal vent metagenome TaxID=652676 RepID=A0A1W1BSE3_9ZZZZ